MSSYNKVRQNAAHTRIALLTATFCIGLKSSSGQSPYLLWQLPINPDSSFLKKADKCLGGGILCCIPLRGSGLKIRRLKDKPRKLNL
jgi:hypothetical protein